MPKMAGVPFCGALFTGVLGLGRESCPDGANRGELTLNLMALGLDHLVTVPWLFISGSSCSSR